MYLKNVVVKNWQSIEKADINPEPLTVFIGPPNQGKSGVISAILYFLNYRELQENDIRDKDAPLEILGIFSEPWAEEKEQLSAFLFEDEISLKIIKEPGEPARYYYFSDKRTWEEADHETYLQIMGFTDTLFVPDISSREQNERFFLKLIRMLDKRRYGVRTILENLEETRTFLAEKYVSKGFHRKLILEALKNVVGEFRKLGRPFGDGIILFFEEPELYLHPQASKELYEIFQNLTETGFQIFLTTHSSNFVALKDYKSLCIVRDAGHGTEVFQYKGNLFSGDEIQNFNMNYWINPDRGELFFARRVILVEGQTDKIVLGALAKKIDVYQYEYSIIECGSKGIIPQFIKLLNAFSIPYVAVYDKDNHFWRSKEEIENSNSHNRDIRRAINPKFGRHVEFENDIEEEIYNEKRDRKNYKNKPFFALQAVMAEKYAIPQRLRRKIVDIFAS